MAAVQPHMYLHNALHSNLVIFKSSGSDNFAIILKSFTFQSGYIQIKAEREALPEKTNFTFQSGYIQMICKV